MASREGQVVVRGYRELLRACDRSGRETKRAVRGAFRNVGEVVRADAARDFSKFSEKSAAGFKVRVRQRGVSVEQSLRKTTGRRPDWGALQMTKALLPARAADEALIQLQFELALDKVIATFNR